MCRCPVFARPIDVCFLSLTGNDLETTMFEHRQEAGYVPQSPKPIVQGAYGKPHQHPTKSTRSIQVEQRREGGSVSTEFPGPCRYSVTGSGEGTVAGSPSCSPPMARSDIW